MLQVLFVSWQHRQQQKAAAWTISANANTYTAEGQQSRRDNNQNIHDG